ncbi:MAG: helix-turn-helix domain-containing protein [Enterovibrio sp.]
MKDFGEIATAQYYTALQKRLGLTNKEAADLFGVHITTIKKWRNGTHRPSVLAVNTLIEMAKKAARDV